MTRGRWGSHGQFMASFPDSLLDNPFLIEKSIRIGFRQSPEEAFEEHLHLSLPPKKLTSKSFSTEDGFKSLQCYKLFF